MRMASWVLSHRGCMDSQSVIGKSTTVYRQRGWLVHISHPCHYFPWAAPRQVFSKLATSHQSTYPRADWHRVSKHIWVLRETCPPTSFKVSSCDSMWSQANTTFTLGPKSKINSFLFPSTVLKHPVLYGNLNYSDSLHLACTSEAQRWLRFHGFLCHHF